MGNAESFIERRRQCTAEVGCVLYQTVRELGFDLNGDPNDVEKRPGLIRKFDALMNRGVGALWAIMAAGALLMMFLYHLDASVAEANKTMTTVLVQMQVQQASYEKQMQAQQVLLEKHLDVRLSGKTSRTRGE